MKALVTGIAGQDGSYLAEFLLQKGYQVFGFKRHEDNLANIGHIKRKIVLIDGDLANAKDVFKAVEQSMPDEVYNLAAISHVVKAASAKNLYDVNVGGVRYIIEAVKKLKPDAKLFQASSAKMFGGSTICPQNEQTPFSPVSEYAKSKVEAHKLIVQARNDGLFASCGILYNHESPRRTVDFVSRKISSTVARIAKGEKLILKLGNLNAVNDWGFAGDYVKAMHLILQQEKPDDFIIGTGERHTVRDFVNEAFAFVGKTIEWRGTGVDEKGYADGKLLVEVDPQFLRPADTTPSVADFSKIKKAGWKPEVSFSQLVKMMVSADLR
ncbi:MAG: GDP-mannose 4,6-dehydratase [Candidatus Woesearchaeota archaeon]